MSNLEIWYKRVNESKYHRILDFVNRAENLPILTWTKDVSNKLQEFEIHLYNPIDEDSLPIFPKSGDSIAITDFQNNIFNNTFFGVVMSKEYEPIGVTASDDTNWVYTLKVQAPNFSTQEITLDYINSVYINDILPIIFNNTPSLGGILSNGIVIPKHNFGGENFLIPPPKFQGEQFDCLVKILDGIGWTFSYYYYSELNSITGLHIVKQIDMYPKNFLKSAPADWQEGFNFNIYKNGLIDNPDFPALDDNKYIFGENKVSLYEDAYQSKNAIKLKLFIKDSTGEGTKKIITSTGLTDTYNLGGAFEIKSIAIKVFNENGIDVKVKTVTSTTVFTVGAMVSSTINFYQQRLLDNGLGTKMRCKIISSSIEYFSNFTINNSTQTITLETAVIGLAVNDTFELVNCYDILRENLLGYPPDVNGYIVKKLDNEQSTITFTEYDRPEAKKQIVIYYYPISQVYKMQVDNDSIEQTGYRGLTETIKDAVTTEQAEEIFNEYLKLMKPLKELNLLTSHRKSILDINTNVPVVFGDINQNLIVVESSGKILSNYGFYRNKPLIVQDKIRLASYKNNIDDILLKIQNQSLAIANMNLLNDIQEFTIDEDIFEEIGENTLNQLITPIMENPSNILFDRFTMNFISSNVNSYRVILSNDINFIDTIIYNLGIVSDPETFTSADLSIGSFTYPIWVKIQAIRGIELTPFSNIKQVTDNSDQLFAYDYQENSGNILNDNSPNNNDAVIIGTPDWQGGVIVGDISSLQLNGSTNYIETPSFSATITDFTIELAMKFETGDKTAKSYHDFFAKYDGYLNNALGVSLLLEYIPASNDLYFFVFDSTNTVATPKYRYFLINYNLNENIDYTIQASFKLVDSTNSNLNTFEICINGIKISGSITNTGVTNITAVNNDNKPFWIGATRGYASSIIDVSKFKLMRSNFYTEFRTESQALDYYNDLFTRDLVIDSYDLFYFKNQNGTGNTITDELALNNGNINGTADWQSGIIVGDTYSLKLDGSTNYINTLSNDSTTFVDFTKRKVLRFETGDKASKSFHPIIGKYDYYAFTSVNGWNFISEFLPSTNKIILYVFDDTSTLVSLKYRTYEVTYNLLENVDYILQIAFKLDDPSNSNLNTAEICVNGVKISGSWTDYGISNITTIKNISQPIKIGAERGTGSTHDVAKFKSLRSALSTRFRTETEALDDYNILFA